MWAQDPSRGAAYARVLATACTANILGVVGVDGEHSRVARGASPGVECSLLWMIVGPEARLAAEGNRARKVREWALHLRLYGDEGGV